MRFVAVKEGESLDDLVERLLPRQPPADQKRFREALLDANPPIARKVKRLDAGMLVLPETAGQPKVSATTPAASLGAFLAALRGQVGDLEGPLLALLNQPEAEIEAQRKLMASAEVKAAARKDPQISAALNSIAKTGKADASQLKATREVLSQAVKEFDQDLEEMLKRLG